jgi:hypothetical protein
MKTEMKKTMRTRANVSRTSTGKWSFDATVEVGNELPVSEDGMLIDSNETGDELDTHREIVMDKMDSLISALDQRYGGGGISPASEGL